MQRRTATTKPVKLHAIGKRPEYLRLVDRPVLKKNASDNKAEGQRKPEVAEEADDLWDNVPI